MACGKVLRHKAEEKKQGKSMWLENMMGGREWHEMNLEKGGGSD